MLSSFIHLACIGLAVATPIPNPQFGGGFGLGGAGGGGIPKFPGLGGAAGGAGKFAGLGGGAGAGGLPKFPGLGGAGGGGGIPKFPGLGGAGGAGGFGGLGGAGGAGGFGLGGAGAAASAASTSADTSTSTSSADTSSSTDTTSSPATSTNGGNGCTSYTIINTRGTGERQGPSSGFKTMNANVLAAESGGKVYDTVYPAGFNQNSASGTADILRQMDSELATNPSQCFILEGYSQGAAATVNALAKMPTSDPKFDATKGVFLIGNPEHKPGLACNVDTAGGKTTENVNGISAAPGGGIPAEWVSKTLDVCKAGDGICDATSGFGVTAAHLAYPVDAGTQDQGTKFVSNAIGA